MLSGDNSILQRATDAKTNTNNSQIKEKIKTSYLAGLTRGNGSITEEVFIEELKKEFGASKVNDDTIDTSVVGKWTVTIDGVSQELSAGATSAPTVLTIGSEYEKGNIKIGDKLTYSANGQTDWIVFGKDESGNVLLASETPVGSYSPTYDAQHWLSWEDDLDAECRSYGTTLQGKTIQARSIRIEDINRVVGFTEPEFKTYKFTTDDEAFGQFENGKVNYYYPSLDAASNSPAYLQKATVTTLTATAPAVPAKEFECNAYYYRYDTFAGKCEIVNGSNGVYYIDTATNLKKYDNMKYAVGETDSFMLYFVASRSVNVSSGGADFEIAFVRAGYVCRYDDDGHMCGSNSREAGSGRGPSGWGLRPIVILPSDIQVEEVTAGKFDIKN